MQPRWRGGGKHEHAHEGQLRTSVQPDFQAWSGEGQSARDADLGDRGTARRLRLCELTALTLTLAYNFK